MSSTYIGVARELDQTFCNVVPGDLVVYAAQPSRLMLGTQQNALPKLAIGLESIVMSDPTVFQKGMTVSGTAVMVNDLYVRGDLYTQQDLVLNGIQVSAGATYCNGDVTLMNTLSSAFSNANMLISSLYGRPIISLHQTMMSNHGPMLLYQDMLGAGYVMNSNNIHFGAGNTPYATFVNTGSLGIGFSNPRAKLDVYRGNVNARNLNKLKKSTTSNDVFVTINWENVPASGETFVVETFQQLNAPNNTQGSKTQKHNIMLTSPSYTHMPQIATTMGNVAAFSSLFMGMQGSTGTSLTLRSFINGVTSVASHEFDCNILMSPSNLGHVWLT